MLGKREIAVLSGTAVSRRRGKLLFLTVALDILALGVMVPVLPKLVLFFEGGDVAAAAQTVGMLALAWAAMQFFSSPIVGALSDRFGRRPVLLLSNLGLCLDCVLMALAPSLVWLVAGRIISGALAASFPTGAAYIADITPPEQRAARIGLLGAAFGLGFTLGPALGGMLGEISLRLPFWIAAGLGLANAAFVFFVLPESLPCEHRSSFRWRSANPAGSLTLLVTQPRILSLTVVAFIYFLGHQALHSTFVLYTEFRYSWGAAEVGLALAGVGIGSVIVSGGLIRPAVSHFGDRAVLLTGLLFGVAGFVCYAFAPTGLLFALSTPLLALWGLSGPTTQSLMTRQVDPSEQGQLQGALSSLRGMAGLLGPLLFTQVFASSLGTPLLLPGSPYLLVALLLVLAILVALIDPSRGELESS